jgi:hypothetical protein
MRTHLHIPESPGEGAVTSGSMGDRSIAYYTSGPTLPIMQQQKNEVVIGEEAVTL